MTRLSDVILSPLKLTMRHFEWNPSDYDSDLGLRDGPIDSGEYIKGLSHEKMGLLIDVLKKVVDKGGNILLRQISPFLSRPKEEYTVQTVDDFDPKIEDVRRGVVSALSYNDVSFLPDDILFSTKQECRLGCKYCYQGQDGMRTSPELDLDPAVKFYEDAREREPSIKVGLWGGEPVLDLDKTMGFLGNLLRNGGGVKAIQTNGQAIRTYDDACRFLSFLEANNRTPERGNKLLTLCVDQERENRFQEQYGGDILGWATNILQAWLDTCGPSKIGIRYVLMRDDLTRLKLIKFLIEMLEVQSVESISLEKAYCPISGTRRREVIAEPGGITIVTEKGEYKVEFNVTYPFLMGGAGSCGLPLIFTDEAETRMKNRGHPECGTHWVVKPTGQVAHCITLDTTDVHDIGNIRDGLAAVASNYNNDPVLRLLRDPKNRRRTFWQMAYELDPSVRGKRFNPIAPMCQFLFAQSALKLRITRLLALDALNEGDAQIVGSDPVELFDEQAERDLAQVKKFIVR